ncbi:MAG: sodium:proton antiporter [Pirellulales bacterium]
MIVGDEHLAAEHKTTEHQATGQQDTPDLHTVEPEVAIEPSWPTTEHDPEADVHHVLQPPPIWTVLPFVLILGAIAVFPLVPGVSHWWESNLHRFEVAVLLGTLTLAYYLLLHPHPVERHFLGHGIAEPAAGSPSFGVTWTVFQNAIFNEYIPFIVLLFSLYTISGGIRIEGDLRAHPVVNSSFLAIGGVLASFIGTTGAAMLLVRPLLETNRERRHVVHTMVFFIFIVCNCGGCLTPLGDPPLFLGYLQGVPFLWTFKLWPQWLLVNGALLAVYFVWDHFYAYPRETKQDIARDERMVSKLRFSGVAVNGTLLALLIVSVGLLDPSKTIPGTTWHPWLFLREVVQLGLVALSLGLGSAAVRLANRFSYGAIIEVAALFLGIFVCMQPALQILDARGAELGIDTPRKFFWATGTLSSVLDNAPTYLVFFETAKAISADASVQVAGVAEHYLLGISFGAVFMGAMTYIGNGPNFMVKAIAEASGVRMPGFFGYVVYSLLVLLPILVLATLLLP